MRFHWPSFLIGYGAGVATSALSRRLRPLVVELVTLAYRTADGLAARLVMKREDLDDLFAEARGRARGEPRPEPGPGPGVVH
jgi:hypothetical protein